MARRRRHRHNAVQRRAWLAVAPIPAAANGIRQHIVMVPFVALHAPVRPAALRGSCASGATAAGQPGTITTTDTHAGFLVLLTTFRFQSTDAGLHCGLRLGTAEQAPLWLGHSSWNGAPMRRSCAMAQKSGNVAAC